MQRTGAALPLELQALWCPLHVASLPALKPAACDLGVRPTTQSPLQAACVCEEAAKLRASGLQCARDQDAWPPQPVSANPEPPHPARCYLLLLGRWLPLTTHLTPTSNTETAKQLRAAP